MKTSTRTAWRNTARLTRTTLALVALTLATSCVTPKPPNSKEIALKPGPGSASCANQIINVTSKPRATLKGAWDPCVVYQPGAVRSPVSKDGKSEDVLILAALSGGGKRSASFAYGVFSALNEMKVELAKERTADAPQFSERNLLEEVDLISAVSGGAMTASYYALHRGNTFLPENVSCGYERFLYEDTGARIKGLYLLPWRWGWMFDSSYGSNDVMAKFFSERLFGMPAEKQYQAAAPDSDLSSYCGKQQDDRPDGALYADLYDKGPPFLLLASTDITRGLTFPYTQDGFDLICADVSAFPLAWALAGTNAFPVVLSTINMRNNHADPKLATQCIPVRNRELVRVVSKNIGCVPLESVLDEKSKPTVGQDNKFFRSDTLLKTAMTCYARPEDAHYVHLADGGMTDNFGLKGITDWFHTHRHSSEFWYLVHTTRRAQLLIIDGQRDVDPKIAGTAQGPGVLDAVGTMISNSVDQSNISSFAETRDLFDVLSTFLALRDLQIFDEWQKETYGTSYRRDDIVQFTKFLDGLETSQPPPVNGSSPFDKKFSLYVGKIKTQYANPDEDARRLIFEPLSNAMDVIQIAELYGSAGSAIDWNLEENKETLGRVLKTDKPATIDQLLQADQLLRRKLERVKEFHAGKDPTQRTPRSWVKISKLSVVDDCNSSRRKLVMSSDTGMGLDEPFIAGAIAAGKDVALRHKDSILKFLTTGERTDPIDCTTWSGSKAAGSGAAEIKDRPKTKVQERQNGSRDQNPEP